MIIQIIITVFALFALTRLILRFKDGEVNLTGLLLWGLVWTSIIVMTYLPQITERIAKLVGVGRGVDALVYISIVFLLYSVFRISVKLEHLEYEITQMVRKEALKEKNK